MKSEPLAYIELSKKNLESNLKSLRGLASPKTKFALAIKGNAYGHGQNEIAKLAEKFADYFLINSLSELVLLRKVSKKKALILGYVPAQELEVAIKQKCIMAIFDIDQFLQIEKTAKKLGKVQEVHIACDVFLGREGFSKEDIAELFLKGKKMKNVKITGMYGHFANIEDTNNFSHAERQISEYKEMLEIAKSHGYNNLESHISATSGLLAYEKNHGFHNIVRIGIGMYGLWPGEHLEYFYGKDIELKPVLLWKTHVAQVRTIPAGRTIGYGLTYLTKKPTKVALIPLGYSDGFPRSLSNTGEVLIAGKRCKVLGRVSMNMFVVDVSSIEEVLKGDEVVIIGMQGGEHIRAEELAQKTDTINYEATSRISPLLPRIVK